MKILPLTSRLERFLARHQIREMFEKQKFFFEHNPHHPSLNTELLEPKHVHLYSFRITQKYRAIFIYTGNDAIEIIDINAHYH